MQASSRFELLRHLAGGQRLWRIGGHIHHFRNLLQRNLRLLAQEVDGPVTGDRHHPR